MKYKLGSWVIPLVLLLTVNVSAHPGGVNAEGCHTNRKTGEYHCHNFHVNRDTSVATKQAISISSSDNC